MLWALAVGGGRRATATSGLLGEAEQGLEKVKLWGEWVGGCYRRKSQFPFPRGET